MVGSQDRKEVVMPWSLGTNLVFAWSFVEITVTRRAPKFKKQLFLNICFEF